MTLQQFSVYRSLKTLHVQYTTEDFVRPDGIVTVIQYEEPNKLRRIVDIDKDGRCKVVNFEPTGPVATEVFLPRERKSFKNRRKTVSKTDN